MNIEAQRTRNIDWTPAPQWVRRLQLQIRGHRLSVVALATTSESKVGDRDCHVVGPTWNCRDRSVDANNTGAVDFVKHGVEPVDKRLPTGSVVHLKWHGTLASATAGGTRQSEKKAGSPAGVLFSSVVSFSDMPVKGECGGGSAEEVSILEDAVIDQKVHQTFLGGQLTWSDFQHLIQNS